MGEYADDYFRNEVKSKFGFDPGPNDKPSLKHTHGGKVACPKCSKRVKVTGLKDHMRTVHHIKD